MEGKKREGYIGTGGNEIDVLVFSTTRFTFEKICALVRKLIGGNNEISNPIN